MERTGPKIPFLHDGHGGRGIRGDRRLDETAGHHVGRVALLLRSLRMSFTAAVLYLPLCTRMSRSSSSLSTARQSQCSLPAANRSPNDRMHPSTKEKFSLRRPNRHFCLKSRVGGLWAKRRESRPANIRPLGTLLRDRQNSQNLYSAWWWTQPSANLSHPVPPVFRGETGN